MSIVRTVALAAAEKEYPKRISLTTNQPHTEDCACSSCDLRDKRIDAFTRGYYLAGCEREPSDTAELERLRAIEARASDFANGSSIASFILTGDRRPGGQ